MIMLNPSEKEQFSILIVDDESKNIQLLGNILRNEGYSFEFATNGEGALNWLESQLFHLILLDLMMPVMDGYEVCSRIKKKPQTSKIPVIFLSAKTDMDSIVRGFEMGAVDYVSKPFNQYELLARVETHLQLYLERTRLQRASAQLEQQNQLLQTTKEKAEAANKAKSVFLANMSHELRTPLNAILGFSQMMSYDQDLTSKQKERLQIINRSGEYLLGVINDILDLSKIEAGKIVLNTSVFDLFGLLNDLELMLGQAASKKDLQLSFHREPDVPQSVHSDQGKLRQILVNLIGNAVKFTEKGHVTLNIKSPSATSLLFEIEDTGPGIDDVDRIFEAFVQSETGKREKEGTGLGLPISQRFVQLLGGEIEVETEIGKGSIFRFQIKIKPLVVSNMPTGQAIRRVIGLKPNEPAGAPPVYRILIVDDNWESRQILHELLTPLGFEIQDAENGKECVDIYRKWHTDLPDLIFMDLRMPVMNGAEATSEIRRITGKAHSPVIIGLTASAFDEQKDELLSAGCNDFLGKPFKSTEIFRMIQEHLDLNYIYEDDSVLSEKDQEQKNHSFFTETLENIPQEWKIKMKNAIENANYHQMLSLAEEIRTQDNLLVDQLIKRIQNFEYDYILELL